eukprot:CAMPEP_0179899384 /NCGR_PEP_ID=MMETSP0982-20121206/38359_1 /TAXON_ID=483367 /ORGANISM="non described non described, Strain CCMP 2436" /LENGTH=144 /DNA_ID=CAMNT_0021797175 /DNA_START=210 /DNA_END=640 /DNA_ORIENTATION=+
MEDCTSEASTGCCLVRCSLKTPESFGTDQTRLGAHAALQRDKSAAKGQKIYPAEGQTAPNSRAVPYPWETAGDVPYELREEPAAVTQALTAFDHRLLGDVTAGAVAATPATREAAADRSGAQAACSRKREPRASGRVAEGVHAR